LKAELHVRRLVESSVIAVEGKFSAGVVQECVVTLEPLEARIKGTIAERFAPVGDARTEFVLADEDEDLEEPLEGDSIDLGEIVAQSLSLALDPYPRKHGAAFEPVAEESDSEPPGGPFAALATLNESDG